MEYLILGNSKRDKFLQNHKEKLFTVSTHEMYPKFSFEFCFGNKRSIDSMSKQTKQAVIEKLIYLSKLTWGEVKGLPRKQGFEKINKGYFKEHPNIPAKFIDINKIDVCRISGDPGGRIIGYIEDETFFIVWVDTKFNMYPHN